MKFLPLVWRNLARRKARTLFTTLSIVVAFTLFGVLSALKLAFTAGVDVADMDRLIMTHKVSIIQLLPISYEARIEAVPGVVEVMHQTYFGGVYQDPKNFFMQLPVDPADWRRMYPEYVLPEDQWKRFAAERTCAVVGEATAERFGWKVGDRVPIQATIWTKPDGSRTWEFDICGIYGTTRKGADTTPFIFRYDYFDEGRRFGQGLVGWYVIRIADPAGAAATIERLDGMFANSEYETKTVPEKAFAQAFAAQVGDVGSIIAAIVTAVFFTILLVAANTMAQSVRERTSELAVLKTLGFGNRLVLFLVLLESCAIGLSGGSLGLLLAWAITHGGDPTGGLFPAFYIPAKAFATGAALALGLGLVAGLMPAVQAMRLRIADALRRT
ncbi:MAG: ABC transporter permease [Vicinamibacterales bacterium]